MNMFKEKTDYFLSLVDHHHQSVIALEDQIKIIFPNYEMSNLSFNYKIIIKIGFFKYLWCLFFFFNFNIKLLVQE